MLLTVLLIQNALNATFRKLHLLIKLGERLYKAVIGTYER